MNQGRIDIAFSLVVAHDSRLTLTVRLLSKRIYDQLQSMACLTINDRTFGKHDLNSIMYHTDRIYHLITNDEIPAYFYLTSMISHDMIIHLAQHDYKDIICWIVNVFQTLRDLYGLKYIDKHKLVYHIDGVAYVKLFHLENERNELCKWNRSFASDDVRDLRD